MKTAKAKGPRPDENARLRTRIETLERTLRDLRDIERRLNAIVEAVGDGICMIDQDYHLVYVNPVLEMIMGPWKGRLCYEYFNNRTCVCPTCRSAEVFAGNTVRKVWYCSKNERSYELLDRPLENPDGTVQMLEVFRDITDRRAAEQALYASEQEYRRTLDFMTDAIHVVDEQCRITLANKAFYDWHVRLGLSVDVIGKDVLEVYPFLESSIRQEYDRVFRTGEPVLTEETNTVAGQQILAETRKMPIFESGRVAKVLTVIRDITNRRRAEETKERERQVFHLIAEASIHANDTTDLCRRILEGLTKALGFDFATFRLYDENDRILRVVAVKGVSGEVARAKIRDQAIEDPGGVAAYVARTRKRIFAPDITQHESLSRFRPRLEEMGARSMISCPIISATGRLLGVMHLGSLTPKEIPEGDVELFQTVAGTFTVSLERMRAGEALQSSERRYRTLFEGSPTPLWEEDFSAVWQHIAGLRKAGVNDFRTYFGEHPGDVLKCADLVGVIEVNQAALDLYGVQDLQEFRCVSNRNMREKTFGAFRDGLVAIAEGTREFGFEYTSATAGGEDRFLRLAWSVAPGYEKSLARVLVSVVDLTDRKRAEDAVRRAELQLRRYSEELEHTVTDRTERIRELEHQRGESEKLAATGRMAARIAHEINNPLAGIKNAFLLVKNIMDNKHPHFAYAELIEKEIDRIAHIVRRMFDLYSPDRMRSVPLNIADAIRDVAGLLDSTCRAAGIAISVNLPSKPIRVTVPTGYVDQILFNLLQNAIEASKPDDVIAVTAEIKSNLVVLTVADQGRGIAPDVADHVFEPFFTTKAGTGAAGLGLGLSVSKGMAEAMGGTIEFKSQPSKGAVFTVTFPHTDLNKEDGDGFSGPGSSR